MAEEKQLNKTQTPEERASELWKMYEDGKEYQNQVGLTKNVKTFVDFFEGRQWPAPTKDTKNLPRPVFNIIKFICRNKKSAILSTPVKLVYRAEDELKQNAEKFTNFADYIQKEYGQEQLDSIALNDGVKKGTYIYHYYWDSERKGKQGVQDGGMGCDIIDLLDFVPANPQEKDEQKQEWIIIASRENVDSVKSKADENIDKDLIVEDECESKYGEVEKKGSKLCTVLTRYFRKDGEVYFEKSVKATLVNAATSLTPDLQAAKKEVGLEEDEPNNNLPDENGFTNPNYTAKANLYPIVVGQYEEREKSIYGIGEIEGLIPNQKSINFTTAMHLMNIEDLAWGKWVVAEDALEGQTITNEPGQVLVNHSKTGGIQRVEGHQIPNSPLNAVEFIASLTRTMAGANEVMSGEVVSANMSGAAIAQLQSQAQQPIEELKDSFWRVKEKIGKVLAQFFKLFYQGKEFSYSETKMVEKQGKMVEEEQVLKDTFNGSEFQNQEFSVVVETTAGTKASAAGDINALDTLLIKGFITPKAYLKAYPKNALSNKTELIKALEEEENSQINQLNAQIQEMTAQSQQLAQQLQESINTIHQQKDIVDKVVSVIAENNKLKSQIAMLYAEGKSKIDEANQAIATTEQDAQDITQMLINTISSLTGVPAEQVVQGILQGGTQNGMSQVQNGYVGQGSQPKAQNPNLPQ
jgi:hypothetical protein